MLTPTLTMGIASVIVLSWALPESFLATALKTRPCTCPAQTVCHSRLASIIIGSSRNAFCHAARLREALCDTHVTASILILVACGWENLTLVLPEST